ncbi:MAG: RluA family pseudouridine synthase [Magnetococcales bacterium]|nr:RluA family pseudouridine synthase [Magnetococcales bacterium]
MEAKSLEGFSPERIPVRQIVVTLDEAGMRLDRFIRHHTPGVPPALVQRWLRTGQSRLNGKRAAGSERLEAGQTIRLPPFETRAPARPEAHTPPEWAMRILRDAILWRDPALLIVNKPPGLPVHGGSGQEWGVVDAMRLLLEREGQGEVPELCHRLDKETSGCLVLALNKMTARQMSAAFKSKEVDKEYWAWVAGTPQPPTGIIAQPLLKGATRGGERMVVAAVHGLSARTRYQLLEQHAGFSLVAAYPDTGRTHQIRVHLQWLGHPVAGDEKYGHPEVNRQLRALGIHRMTLHARRIGFVHPATGRRLEIEAPLDAAFTRMQQRVATPQPAVTQPSHEKSVPDSRFRYGTKPDGSFRSGSGGRRPAGRTPPAKSECRGSDPDQPPPGSKPPRR